MLRLTDYLGCRVIGPSGERVAKLKDLAVTISDPATYPPVTALLVETGRRTVRSAQWEAVSRFDTGGIELRGDASVLSEVVGGEAELLLAADVLDTQIVDIAGKRLVRVADVDLVTDGELLRMAGVEIGLATLLERIGLRRLARRARSEELDWRELHPTSGRAHALQLSGPAARVHRLHPEELAALVEHMPIARAAETLHAVEPHKAGHALAAAPPELASRLIRELHPSKVEGIIGELPDETREHLLGQTHPERRRRYRRILSARRRAPS